MNNNHVFMVKRRDTDWAQGLWNFPGGLVEQGEAIAQAALREAQEETGVLIDSEDLQLVQVLHIKKGGTNTRDIVGIYFRASSWKGTPTNAEPDRHSDAQWFSLSELPSEITDHALLAVDAVIQKRGYSEHGW